MLKVVAETGLGIVQHVRQWEAVVKKLLLTGVTAIVIGLASNAAHAQFIDFKTLEPFAWECENSSGSQVVLAVNPAENTVTLYNEKGENFTFNIARAQAYKKPVLNRFGNYTSMVSISWVDFLDNAGQPRTILTRGNDYSFTYMPAPPNKQRWGYTCLFTNASPPFFTIRP